MRGFLSIKYLAHCYSSSFEGFTKDIISPQVLNLLNSFTKLQNSFIDPRFLAKLSNVLDSSSLKSAFIGQQLAPTGSMASGFIVSLPKDRNSSIMDSLEDHDSESY